MSEITAEFDSAVKSVWDVVTDLQDTAWRSDIARIEVLNGGSQFIEYTSNGNTTKFTITKKNELSEYEFSMENKMFTGYWRGTFAETEAGGTRVIFTENILIRNPIVRLLSYLLMDLGKMQRTYIADLKKRLGETS